METRFQRGHIFDQLTSLISAKIKRNVSINEPLRNNDICLVCRNDVVILNTSQQGLAIVAKSTALSDGSLGDQIKVRNSKSNRVVSATITGVGQVAVKF